MKLKENYLIEGTKVIKAHGLKLTRPRKQILEFLAVSEKAMTPYEMRDTLKGVGQKSDVVTIYRILEEFSKLGLVHKVMSLGRFIRCREGGFKHHCERDDGCHHYIICKNCHKVEEITGENLHDLEKIVQTNLKYKVLSHTLEFLGLCPACQRKAGSPEKIA